MNVRLMVQTSKSSFRIQYSGESLRMGRNDDCEVSLSGCAVVSGQHAQMEWDELGWKLSDLASKNGTYLNGKKIQAAERLKIGDTIRLGSGGPKLKVVEMEQPCTGSTLRADPQAINRTVLADPPPAACDRTVIAPATPQTPAVTVLHPQAMQQAIPMPTPAPVGHDGARLQPAYAVPAPANQSPSPTRLMLRQVLAGQKRSWVVNFIAGFVMLAVVSGVTLCFAFDWNPFHGNGSTNELVAQKPKGSDSDSPKQPNDSEKPGIQQPKEQPPAANPPGKKPNTAKKLTEEQIFQHGLRSACMIRFPSNDPKDLLDPNNFGKDVIGAGTIFDREKRLILVNHHMARKAPPQFKVYFPKYGPDGEPIMERQQYIQNRWFVMGKVVASDPSLDLAVVQVDQMPETSKAATLAEKGPKSAQEVHAVGGDQRQDLNSMWGYTDGTVKSVVQERPRVMPHVNAKIIRSDMLAKQVLDGTGVFNDRGELVGVDFTADFGDANRMHINISDVRRFLQSQGYLN